MNKPTATATVTQPAVQLLPCPFCGHPARLSNMGANYHQASCSNALCDVVCVAIQGNLENVARSWNNRPAGKHQAPSAKH